MGTNYYIRIEECEKCKRHDEVHIGKSSFGWEFSFHSPGKHIKTTADWRKVTKEHKIFDEYSREISYKEFWELVKSKKGDLNHTKESYDGYIDSEGNSFSESEFC